MRVEQTAAWAAIVARRFVEPLGHRWKHVRSVAALAQVVGQAFGEDEDVLIAAAYLHDIGYSPELANTGFHPLDGARYLRAEREPRLASLVAHHSGARNEAELRGFDDFLVEFPFEGTELDEALTYCDLTTGPDGRRVTLEDRVGEIQERYGAEHVVSRAIRIGQPEFVRARDNTEQRMAQAGITVSGWLEYPH